MYNHNYVKICPKCSSTEVYRDYSQAAQVVTGAPTEYICRSCNHTSYVFPEIKKSQIRKTKRVSHKKNPKQETNFAGGYSVYVITSGIMGLILATIAIFFGFYSAIVMFIYGAILFTLGIIVLEHSRRKDKN